MIVFPNCKINLGLSILRKRADGFHDLETVFFPLQLKDALELITDTEGNGIQFTCSGIQVDGDETDNLCVKAYQLLKKDFPQIPAVKMHLHKAIPLGAGLGGGSADGASALKLINEKFGLGLSTEQLLSYAASLGSDAPFFILNKPSFASGRGEILEEISLDLSSYELVLVNPAVHINTGQAFTQLSPVVPERSIREIIQQPVSSWKDQLLNDFEKPVFAQYPSIGTIKETLYAKGAVYAAMSGSGSTVFGLFNRNEVPAFEFPAAYFVRTIKL